MADFTPKNPNIFQAEGSFSQRDGTGDPAVSIRCPHCQHVGTFLPSSRGISYPKVNQAGHIAEYTVFLRICPNAKCRGTVLTISRGKEVEEILPHELIDFDPTDLPADLLETLKEAIACHSVGAYRATAMMVRRIMEEICEDAGAEGKNLFERLQALKTKITLPHELFEAMTELKALGNDAAHIDARTYSNIGEDEASDSIELAKEILKSRYQLKSLVERLRSRKKPSD